MMHFPDGAEDDDERDPGPADLLLTAAKMEMLPVHMSQVRMLENLGVGAYWDTFNILEFS